MPGISGTLPELSCSGLNTASNTNSIQCGERVQLSASTHVLLARLNAKLYCSLHGFLKANSKYHHMADDDRDSAIRHQHPKQFIGFDCQPSQQLPNSHWYITYYWTTAIYSYCDPGTDFLHTHSDQFSKQNQWKYRINVGVCSTQEKIKAWMQPHALAMEKWRYDVLVLVHIELQFPLLKGKYCSCLYCTLAQKWSHKIFSVNRPCEVLTNLLSNSVG